MNCNGTLVDLSLPIVMGILNVTPDSFFDGGKHNATDSAVKQADKMIEDGASIIDIGGVSSRPGAEAISTKEELARVLPVIKAIRLKYPNQLISIDTVHGDVAKEAIGAGAAIVNDISGGNIDPKIWDVCVEHKVPYILMHMQGRPETMQDNPQYENVVMDILSYLKHKVLDLKKKGLIDIMIDPGFGFGKTEKQNFDLLNKLSVFRILDCPILIGISRKSMIYKSLGTTADQALNGTTAAHMIALQNGARILRVHDVKEAVETIKIFQLLS